MPITYWTCLVGALGPDRLSRARRVFFSKDALIDCRSRVSSGGLGLRLFLRAQRAYSSRPCTRFRMFFHDFPRRARAWTTHTKEHLHESPWVVTVAAHHARHPFGAVIGWFTVKTHAVRAAISTEPFMCSRPMTCSGASERKFHGSPGAFMWSAFAQWPVWFAALGGPYRLVVFFSRNPALADSAARRFQMAAHDVGRIKYGFRLVSNEHVDHGRGAASWAEGCGASAIRS